MRTFLTLIFLLVIPASGLGQGSLQPPARKNYKYQGKIVSSYDEPSDRTTVLIQLMPVKDVEDPTPLQEHSAQNPRDWSRLDLTLFFSYPATTLITPTHVSIGFLYEAFEPARYKDHTLSANIDGQKLVLGKMDVLSTTKVSRRFAYKPYTRRTLELVIPYEQLLQLANARKVKLILGEFDFNLSKDHLEAIRDLASRTVP